ncbi:MAG: hypothetical protein FWG84_10180 [Bacteroidales bacterium]|nr:hypothetical protein [Bacteroidales bacterium]
MQIANPIYDTVFKYMMSDSKVAKSLLSAIIGEKIVKLEFTSTEYTLKVDVDKRQINRTLEQIVVCRFDFAAKIRTDTGAYKTVIIELQKAKFATDIMRFRRYLGTMYQSAENTYDKKRVKARQIYCIYLLNYEIGLSDSPIIKVDYVVRDLTTGEELNKKNEFIESLNHKSWIVQVRKLKEKRRNELENLLSIFDQNNITADQHILNIDESQFPKEYQHIIRKLREACESKQVREEMQMEDDYINELLMKDEIIAEQEKELEEKDKTIEEKDKTIEEKDKTIEENKKTMESMQKEIERLKAQS